jgi:TolB-like protein
MGEVYLAEDTKLGRNVALKLLPGAMASDPERLQRFRGEARALAALDHPNIVTVHAVEEADGQHFLTMSLVEGRRLNEEIPEGGMPLERLLEIGIALADALAAAHDKGITHRDLKPGNVMLTAEGRVKVLDFGLAKFAELSAADAASAMMETGEGIVVGTAPYMSPEQLQGDPVDHRTDLYSLGVLLYEMIAGHRPFRGSPASVVTSILRDSPAPVERVRGDLPGPLGPLVDRCLAKQPEQRFGSAKDIRNALAEMKRETESGSVSTASLPTMPRRGGRRWLPLAAVAALALVVAGWLGLRDREADPAPRGSPAAGSRIVVLPFENLGDAADDYFAAGMTDELTSRLGGVPHMAVISRKSARHYANTDKSIAQIGSELGVDYVVEGTVRWARTAEGESRVRITPQLIDVAGDTQIWSEVYDRRMDDVFQVQSEIARRIVQQLGLTLAGGELQALETRPTENLEAYQAYLTGNFHLQRVVGGDNLEAAIAFFERAVQLDPDFAMAWSKMSTTHSLIYHLGYDVSDDRRALARRALDATVRSDPDAGATHLARGYYHYWGFKEYEAALHELRLARERLPNNIDALTGEAYVLRRQGHFEEAITIFEQVVSLDPRSGLAYMDLAETMTYVRRFEDALVHYDHSLALQPTINNSVVYKALTLWQWKGRDGLGQAAAALDSSVRTDVDMGRYYHYWQRMFEGRPGDAAAELRGRGDPDWLRVPDQAPPVALLEAFALELEGRDDEARRAFAVAAEKLEEAIERTPDDFRLPGQLGWALSGLDRRDAAIAAAERGVAMMPLERDAMLGPPRLWELAVVHARVGDPEVAVDLLERLDAHSGDFTAALFEMHPLLATLRDDPRYRALVDR